MIWHPKWRIPHQQLKQTSALVFNINEIIKILKLTKSEEKKKKPPTSSPPVPTHHPRPRHPHTQIYIFSSTCRKHNIKSKKQKLLTSHTVLSLGPPATHVESISQLLQIFEEIGLLKILVHIFRSPLPLSPQPPLLFFSSLSYPWLLLNPQLWKKAGLKKEKKADHRRP